MEHGQVAVVRGGVDEPAEHGAGDPAQRLLARVGGAELERRDPEPVAALLGQVHDEALVAQHGQQVVDARARQPELARDRRRGHRRGVTAEQLQHAERVGGGGSVGHAASVSDPRHKPHELADSGPPGVSSGHGRHAARHGRPSSRARRRCPSTTWSAVARHGARGRLTDEALAAIAASRRRSRRSRARTGPHYGVSTGFGALATRHIPPERRAALQRSLIRSHAAGSGPEVEREVVRAMMRAAALDARHRPHRRPPGPRGRTPRC